MSSWCCPIASPRRAPTPPLGHAARLLVLLAAAWLPRAASAQPVGLQLRNDVPGGQRPSLIVTGVERVRDLQLALTRDDGKHFVETHAALEAGKSVTLPIGDGAAGKAHFTGRLTATVAGAAEGAPWSYDLSFDTVVRASVTVGYDGEHLDLANHRLQFTLSRPAGKAELVALDEDGKELGRGSAAYHKEKPGSWLPIAWAPKPGATGRLLVLRLHAVAADGLAANVELIPWTVPIEHEDVTFATDSAAIERAEAAKLDASLKKIDEVAARAARFVQVRLYVAGHTDTVGGGDHNRKLSLDRARAIAEYFRKRGLRLPISYDGFGEDLPKVPTPDNTDEPRNRRVDYVLGAIGAAPPAGYHGDWKSVK